MKKDLTQELLHELFDYCDERGALIWKKRGPGRIIGKPAGRKHYKTGYIDIGYNGAKYAAHRMICIWHNGPIPKDMVIDHINGIVDDNRISNLQVCSISENRQKSVVRTDNKSGVVGVCWSTFERRWIARIQLDGKVIYIGSSKDKQEVIDMRLKAEKEAFGDFAPSNHAYTGQPTGEFNDSND